ncbi:MAG: hypothetical protein HYU66_24345 [Armatimonadetes bacterium]|nr:hypothetical protein [Armatimonadota bacterium]
MLALLLTLPILAADLPAGVTLARQTGQLVFANSAVELRFDSAIGRWLSYSSAGGEAVIAGGGCGAYLKAAQRWTDESPGRLEDAATDAAGGQGLLRLTSRVGDFRQVEEWRLAPGSTIALRQCAWEYLGTAQDEVGSTRFLATGVKLPGADDAELVLPGGFPAQTVPFAALQPGRRRDVPDCWSTNGLVLVRSAKQDRALVMLSLAGLDSPWAHVEEAAGSVRLEQGFGTQLRLGQPASFAARWQAVALCGASRKAITEACWQAFDRIGLRAVANPAADRATVYSAHPGGTIDSGFRDVGGFREFTGRLGYLRDLGCNTLWLLPFWNGYVYAPIDYAKLDEKLGTEADLKALVDRAHELGIRVLGDLIPHGPREEGGLLKTHPEWVSAKHDGGVLSWWGCLGCDYAHPGWQGFMADHAVDWMKRVGLDGYRVDCAAGGPENWRPYGENWPSLSGMTGGRELLAAVRAKMQAQTPGSLLITEGTAPWLAESGDIVYDFPWAYTVLPAALRMPMAEWVPAAREWLAWRRAMYPRGTRLMRYATSHDTLRGPWRYGPDLERSLLALNALLDGVPMVYDGEEEGFADTVREVNAWRAALPALQAGEADFDAVQSSDPRVMAFVRRAKGQTVVVAVSFASQFVRTKLTATDAELFSTAKPYDCNYSPGPDPAGTVSLGRSKAVLWVSPAAPAPEPPRAEGRPTLPAPPEASLVRLTADRFAGEAWIDPAHGARLQAYNWGPRLQVLGSRFSEGRRKLFLGVPPMDLDVPAVTTQHDGRSLTARFTLNAADGQPAVDVIRRYELGYWEDRHLIMETTLTARRPVERANAALVQSFDLGPAPKLYVLTVEGSLYYPGPYPPPRRPTPPDSGRYRHPFGNVLWESRRLPPAGSPLLWGDDHITWEASASRPGWLQNVRLRRDVDAAGHVWLEVAWLDEREPVSLAAGESVTLTVGLGEQLRGEPVLRNDAASLLFENPHYHLALSRANGGSISELRRKQDDGWGPNLVSALNTYTDVGLYGEWGDPVGEKHRTNARSLDDLEPDVDIRREGQQTTVTFTGTLRGAHNDGGNPVRPYSWYRHAYVLDDSPVIRMRLGFRPRPGIESRETKVFAAHTLTLPGVKRWTAAGGDGATTRDASPTFLERCWQSREHGGLAAGGFALDAEGGTFRIIPGEGANKLQNAFLLDGGGGGFTLFLAPWDLLPAKVPPVWVESEWRVEL